MNRRSRTRLAGGLCLGGLTLAAPAAAQLTAQGNLLLQQGVNGIQDFRSAGDEFGAVLAWGDFDGDGRQDLAIGVPDDDLLGEDEGKVQVVYGGAGGLTARDQRFPRNAVPGAGTAHDGDRMGQALAVGDFDVDGFDDLAIGIPGDVVDGQPEAGSVLVLYGNPSGLTNDGFQLFNQDTDGVFGSPEAGDRFGAALAAGRFSASGASDLVIGIPSEALGDVVEAGGITVLKGGPDGLGVDGHLFVDRGLFDGPDPDHDDRFGAALASGDLNGDGFDDLAIGAPGVDTTGIEAAGEAFVLFGTTVGFIPTSPSRRTSVRRHDVLCRPDGTADGAGVGDRFGSSLAIADFDGEGRSDLAVGVPGATIDGHAATGQVDVVYSGNGDFGDDADCWNQNVPGVGGVFPDGDERFGASVAAGDLTGDGVADLVVGVPGERLGPAVAFGGLHVFHGAPAGLAPAAEAFWSQNSPDVPNGIEFGDAFASAVALGDANGDGFADLAVGVPGEEIDNTKPNHGVIHVFYGGDRIFADGFESGDSSAWSPQP